MHTLFQFQLLPKSTAWSVRCSAWYQPSPKGHSPLGGKQNVLCSCTDFIFLICLVSDVSSCGWLRSPSRAEPLPGPLIPMAVRLQPSPRAGGQRLRPPPWSGDGEGEVLLCSVLQFAETISTPWSLSAFSAIVLTPVHAPWG